MNQFPWMSPYVAFNDNPVLYKDPYGLEAGNGDFEGGPEGGPEGQKKVGETTVDGNKMTEMQIDGDFGVTVARPKASGWTRFWGVVSAVGSFMEAAVGAALIATGVGGPIGVLLLVHGADGMAAGIVQAATGKHTEAFIHKGVRKVAESAGADPETANTIADGADIAISAGAGSAGAGKMIANKPALTPVTAAKVEAQTAITEEAVVAESTREFTQIGTETGTNLSRSTNSKFGEVVINSGHSFNRPHTTGSFAETSLTMDQVENTIVVDLEGYISGGGIVPQAGNNNLRRIISVNGVSVNYAVGTTGNQYRISTYAPILNK